MKQNVLKSQQQRSPFWSLNKSQFTSTQSNRCITAINHQVSIEEFLIRGIWDNLVFRPTLNLCEVGRVIKLQMYWSLVTIGSRITVILTGLYRRVASVLALLAKIWTPCVYNLPTNQSVPCRSYDLHIGDKRLSGALWFTTHNSGVSRSQTRPSLRI